MNNTKYRNFLIIIGVLVLISAGMLAFNWFVLKSTPVEYKQYYRAVRDIPSYTELSSDMFEPVTVESSVNMDGMIDDLASVSGLYSTKALSQGEYLTEDNITNENNEAGLIYTIQINATYVADVAYDDVVDIYSLNQDNSVTLMFGKKKIYRPKTTAIADVATTEDDTANPAYESASQMYIKVTENEMLRYYTSLRDAQLIVLPYDEKNSSELAEQNKEPVENEVIDTFDYIVQEGDTWEIIAENFEVSVEDLTAANEGVDELVPGETITMPVIE